MSRKNSEKAIVNSLFTTEKTVAEKVLAKAKEQEKQKILEGYEYVQVDKITYKLKKK